MSYCEDSNINKSYIVQNVESSDIFSACTEIYLTNIIPCTGDTININSNLNVTGDISGTTFYGDGSQLSGIITTDNYVTGGVYTASTKSLYFTGTTGFTPFSIDVSALLDDTNNYVTGGTYNPSTDIISLFRNDNVTIDITGVTDTFTTGGTYNNNTGLITFDRNDTLSAFTVDLSTIDVNDTFVTGGTLVNTDLILNLNDGSSTSSIDLSGLEFTGNTPGTCIGDIHVSNIHSCSPLRINPNDEGNVYFGSTSGVTIDVINSKLGVGLSNPTFNLDVVSSGGTGSFEDIARFRTIDSDDYLSITNAISTDGTFNPVLRSFNNTNVSTNFYIQSVVDPSVDTGVNPLIMLQGRVSTDPGNVAWSGVTTRPIVRVRNNSTNLLDVTADGKVGIGTTTPNGNLDISNGTDSFITNLDGAVGPYINVVSTDTTKRCILAAVNDTNSLSLGQIGVTNTGSTGYGSPGDSYIYSSAASNGLNIISQPGIGTKDYIRLYAGGNPLTSTASIHIQGSGSTEGYVGIGTETPQVELHVKGDNSILRLETTSATNNNYVEFWDPTERKGFLGYVSTVSTDSLFIRNEEHDANIIISTTNSGGTSLTSINIDGNQNVELPNGNLDISGTLTIGVLGTGTSINNLGIDSSGNIVVGTTGDTDTNTFVTGGTLSGNDLLLEKNNGVDVNPIDLSGLVSGKTDLTLFNSHTGDTNNPHDTSFTNLINTAHTHTISDVINLQTELDSKLNVSEFNTYSGDVQTQIDDKLETSIFNSYTGSVVDVFVSSGNANSVTQQLSFTNTTGGTFNVTNSAALFSDNDVNVTGGTYNPSNGCVTFTTNSGTTFDVCGFVTGITDTFVTGGTLSGTDLVLERSNGIDVSGIDLSSLISGKLDIATFNTYTGDTETILNSKTDNTDFTTHTGDTTIHYTKSSINLSDLGSSAHTHTLSEITDFNSYSGNVQTQLDTKIENGINSGGANEVFSGKSGTDLYYRTLSGGSNTTISTIGDIIKVDVSVPVDTNTFVTGFTYNDANTFTISRNGGLGDLTSTMSVLSGITYYGDGSNLSGISSSDFYVTGGTFSAETLTLDRNDGGSVVVTGFTSQPSLNNGEIFVGDTGNTAQSVTMTGDVNIDNTGVTTIQPDSVTYDKIQDVSQSALLGSSNVSGGTVTEIPTIDLYLTTGSITTLLENTSNWDINGNYTGTTITGTYQGQNHYDGNYFFTAVADNVWIRLIRG